MVVGAQVMKTRQQAIVVDFINLSHKDKIGVTKLILLSNGEMCLYGNYLSIFICKKEETKCLSISNVHD